MKIKYYHRKKKVMEIEKVYGEASLQWVYGTFLGRIFSFITSRPFVSKLYGAMQNRAASVKKIPAFIRNFEIDMELFETQKYANFNEFFIRKFKKESRTFVEEASRLPAFCEARYFGWNTSEEDMFIPVKGKYLTAQAILGEKWSETFDGGPLLIARLCPVDYHRFHFPDNGKVIDQFRVPGALHSVNPIALRGKGNIFCTNERQVSILQTENFGKLAYVEVGATCVGKIVQTHEEQFFKRGDEKGYFLFGGSTVILFGELDRLVIDNDIVENSLNGIESYIELGEAIASKG